MTSDSVICDAEKDTDNKNADVRITELDEYIHVCSPLTHAAMLPGGSEAVFGRGLFSVERLRLSSLQAAIGVEMRRIASALPLSQSPGDVFRRLHRRFMAQKKQYESYAFVAVGAALPCPPPLLPIPLPRYMSAQLVEFARSLPRSAHRVSVLEFKKRLRPLLAAATAAPVGVGPGEGGLASFSFVSSANQREFGQSMPVTLREAALAPLETGDHLSGAACPCRFPDTPLSNSLRCCVVTGADAASLLRYFYAASPNLFSRPPSFFCSSAVVARLTAVGGAAIRPKCSSATRYVQPTLVLRLDSDCMTRSAAVPLLHQTLVRMGPDGDFGSVSNAPVEQSSDVLAICLTRALLAAVVASGASMSPHLVCWRLDGGDVSGSGPSVFPSVFVSLPNDAALSVFSLTAINGRTIALMYGVDHITCRVLEAKEYDLEQRTWQLPLEDVKLVRSVRAGPGMWLQLLRRSDGTRLLSRLRREADCGLDVVLGAAGLVDCRLSPDERTVAAISAEGTQLSLYAAGSGPAADPHIVLQSCGGLYAFEWSPSGMQLAALTPRFLYVFARLPRRRVAFLRPGAEQDALPPAHLDEWCECARIVLDPPSFVQRTPQIETLLAWANDSALWVAEGAGAPCAQLIEFSRDGCTRATSFIRKQEGGLDGFLSTPGGLFYRDATGYVGEVI